MELGNKIKQLRTQYGYTQEGLADKLGVTAQAVSKWENNVTTPDISLLPKLSEVFGVTIDDLFDLTVSQKLDRIENKLDIEAELTSEEFREIESFLKTQRNDKVELKKSTYLLAYLYTHRLMSDSEKIKKYGQESIRLDPSKKENAQWMIGKAQGGYCWDWDISNHNEIISFYKSVVEDNPEVALPYHYLIDNLIADHRVEEATHYLDKLKQLRPNAIVVTESYRAGIALARYDEKEADAIMEGLAKDHADDDAFLFEMAQYYAKKAQYEKAIDYYEVSFAKDKRRPRYVDALLGIATIYDTMGNIDKEIETYDRILVLYKEEWGARDDEAMVQGVLKKIAELRGK